MEKIKECFNFQRHKSSSLSFCLKKSTFFQIRYLPSIMNYDCFPYSFSLCWLQNCSSLRIHKGMVIKLKGKEPYCLNLAFSVNSMKAASGERNKLCWSQLHLCFYFPTVENLLELLAKCAWFFPGAIFRDMTWLSIWNVIYEYFVCCVIFDLVWKWVVRICNFLEC